MTKKYPDFHVVSENQCSVSIPAWALLPPHSLKTSWGGLLQNGVFCPSHSWEVFRGNWKMLHPHCDVIYLMWLTYNEGGCDEVSSFPALVANAEDVIHWGNVWELSRAQPGLFPFYQWKHHIWLPHPCQMWLALRTHKSTSEELFSPKYNQIYKMRQTFFYFFLFKWYKETVSHEAAKPSNVGSIYCSNLTGWKRL